MKNILKIRTYDFLISLLLLLMGMPRVSACTIFCGADSKGHVWAANNEDNAFTFSNYINVFPKTASTKHGYYTFSYFSPENGTNWNIQGGMNEAGLFYDFNALGKQYEVKDKEKKKNFPQGDQRILPYLLEQFQTVQEVVDFFEKYWFQNGFNSAQMHVADKFGNFGIIGPSGSRILQGEKFQISTNFNICAEETAENCWRFPILQELLASKPIGLETFIEGCQRTAQTSDNITIYSNIQNLNTGEIWLYYGLDYQNAYKTSIQELLSKGRKSYLIKDFFESSAINMLYDTFLTSGGQRAHDQMVSLKLPPKQQEGITAIFTHNLVSKEQNLNAFPFLEDYLKVDPNWRVLQMMKAIWYYHEGKAESAIKTIIDYKKAVPETGMDVERLTNRFRGNFDDNPNAFFQLNGYQDCKYVFVKGISRDVGNFLFKKDGKWVGGFRLDPGTYTYSYIVDGTEIGQGRDTLHIMEKKSTPIQTAQEKSKNHREKEAAKKLLIETLWTHGADSAIKKYRTLENENPEIGAYPFILWEVVAATVKHIWTEDSKGKPFDYWARPENYFTWKSDHPKLEEALKMATFLENLPKENPKQQIGAYEMKGFVYNVLGQSEKASIYFQKTLEVSPKNVDNYYRAEMFHDYLQTKK